RDAAPAAVGDLNRRVEPIPEVIVAALVPSYRPNRLLGLFDPGHLGGTASLGLRQRAGDVVVGPLLQRRPRVADGAAGALQSLLNGQVVEERHLETIRVGPVPTVVQRAQSDRTASPRREVVG